MAYRRSLDFLPSVFKTDVNDKFLNSTLDQLISEPELKRLGGYIGRRFSPVAGPHDSFVNEITDLRQNYQLESTTILADGDNKLRFAASYTDLLRKIESLGGYTNDHSRLFSSEIYNYDGFIDYDKFLNYSYYYWLPTGPDAVTAYATQVPVEQTFTVIPPSTYQVMSGEYEFEPFDSIAFDVSENSTIKVRQDGIKFDVTGTKINPTIRLARGGTYTFKLDQIGHGFYIQTEPGTPTSYSWQLNLNPRDVYGVENNGADVGEVIFNVPLGNEQDNFMLMEKVDRAFVVAHSSLKNRALRFNEVHRVLYTDFLAMHGGLDGQRMFENKTVVFLSDATTGKSPQPWAAKTSYAEGDLIIYGNQIYRVLSAFTSGRVFNDNNLELYDLQDNWYVPAQFDSDEPGNGFDSNGFDKGAEVDYESRFSKFDIDIDDAGYIMLTPGTAISKNKKIEILEGIRYGNREVYRDTSDLMSVIPPITANLDKLYYADALDPNINGVIEIINQDNSVFIDIENSILGKKKYESPNGVRFTDGLKVRFLDDVVPKSYANKSYYVEGVGDSITLVDEGSLAIAETWLDAIESTFDTSLFDQEAFSASTNAPITPDYFVINRSSIEKSAWARQNRWFHKDIIELTAKYNNYPPIIESNQRAKRPIIEFDPNIQLFNMGMKAKTPIDVIDFGDPKKDGTDAFSDVEGQAITIKEEETIRFTGTFDIVESWKADRASEGFKLIKETDVSPGVKTAEMRSGGVSTHYADGIPLYPGMRVVFPRDFDPEVRNKIYVVSWIRPQSNSDDKAWTFVIDPSTTSYPLDFPADRDRLSVYINDQKAREQGYRWSYVESSQSIVFDLSPVYLNDGITLDPRYKTAMPASGTINVSLTFDNQIHLEPAEDADINDGDCILVRRGLNYQGQMFHFVNDKWTFAQQKTKINQEPLFDLFDENATSLGNRSTYNSSTFTGNKLFGYARGNTVKDPTLGIRLKYRNINNIGDIVFTDFISSGSFIYKDGQQSSTKSTLGAKVKQNFADGTHSFRNQWRRVRDRSRQYQLQTFFATDYQKNLFKLTVTPAGVGEEQLANIIVYVNNTLLYTNNYDIQKEGGISYLYLNNDLAVNDKVDIMVYSPTISDNVLFSMPYNFTNNPFNKEVTDITLGQMRAHINNALEDVATLSDLPLSEYNIRDTKEIKSYPGKIIENSGNPHLANFFLNDDQANFIDSIIYAQREYTRFKNRFLELVREMYNANELASSIVDRVLIEMAANKNKNFPYFTSDMVAFGNDYNLRTYKVVDTRLNTYDTSFIMDLTKPSDKAILVYLNNRQLLVNRDYVFNKNRPVLELDLSVVSLNVDDIIEIREYSTTDGCFMPQTPSKLGLYPLSTPTIIKDGYDDNERSMIRGHDGSMTVLFGDSRDDALLELETRIYNNIKVSYNTARFDIWNYVPGAFRDLDYSLAEFNSILSSHFSAWSGLNGIAVSDYRQFEANDPFTYNYGRFTNRVDGKIMPAANWRGIYDYYFDTDAPHIRPWEMLGFETEPDWWQVTYGSAPYTAGNEVLWNDLEAGRIAAGDRKGIDSHFARPGLSKIIPVTESGVLRSPMDCIALDINTLDVSGFYKFGDIGPAELAWRQSSEYPFVLQIAISLMKPAEYFSRNIDTNLQVVELNDNQLIFNDTGVRDHSKRLVHSEITEAGEIYRSNSYLTWISEHCRSRGFDITTCLGDRFRNLETRLGYKVAGYTDKNYLRIVTDQYAPSSNNPGVVIPDDDFDVYLNKSTPIQNLTYSGIIITKTVDGYAVTGYDDNKPYFMIESSEINSNKTYIKVGKLVVTKYYDGTGEFFRVPYGTEFYSIDQVADFLISYGRYLARVGFDFSDKLDTDGSWSKDWDLAVREFLFYVQQGWDFDIALSLSPVGDKIKYRSSFGSVDGLLNRPLGTRVLDENFNIIRSDEYTVYRNGRDFSLTVDDTRGIYLLDINVVEHEHVLVFQNITRFNDIIYDPILGDRQYRLKIEGFKTGDWDGTYGAAGFIINDDNVKEWQPGLNYNKGDIVIFKSAYFTAADKIPAESEFEPSNWIKTEYDLIKKGLLPNLANRAGMFKRFYDSNDVNLEETGQLLGKELIGFEPRSYMTDLDVSDTSQFKFYQGMISQKGTLASFDKLLNAKLDNFGGTAKVYEEWAIRLGSYGATNSTQNVQIELDETWASKDPLVIELLNDNDPIPSTHVGLRTQDIYIKPVPFDKNYLPNRTLKSYNSDLYSAGYPQLDDVNYVSPTINDINRFVPVTDVRIGQTLWIAADRSNQWNIYRINESDIKIKSASITSTGDATIRCHNNHGLEKNNIVFIKQDESQISNAITGFFVVTKIVDSSTFVIKTGFGSLNIEKLSGITFTVDSIRFDTAKEVLGSEPLLGWQKDDRLFIYNINENGWAVLKNNKSWEVGPNYKANVNSAADRLGASVATDNDNYYMIAGRPGNRTGRGDIVLYSITNTGYLEEIANLTTNSEGTEGMGFNVTASNDASFAAGAPVSDDIGIAMVVAKNPESDAFRLQQVLAADTIDLDGEFGYAVELSNDGNWLAVGQPGNDMGYVYVYQRNFIKIGATQTVGFYGDGSTTVFTLTGDAANPNSIDSLQVLVDGHTLEPSTEYSLSFSDVILASPPGDNSEVVIIVTRDKPEETFFGDGSTVFFTLTGDNSTPKSVYALYVEVNGVIQVPFRDYTMNVVGGFSVVEFTTPPANLVQIKISQRTNYELVSSFTADDAVAGDRFGHSLAWSDNGYQLLVGAPNTSGIAEDGSTEIADVGRIYIFDRTTESFYANGTSRSFTTNNSISANPYVYVDNERKAVGTDFVQTTNTITFNVAPRIGSIVKIDTNSFNQTDTLSPASSNETLTDKTYFGTSVEICPTNCSVYVGAPGTDNQRVNSGAVFRYVNQGRLFGNITGTVEDPLITNNSVISINNFLIQLDSGYSLSQVISAINGTNIPGVTASNANGYLHIESNSLITGERLLINTYYGTAITDLGLDIYVHQQKIDSPAEEDYAEFGRSISVAPSADLIAIGSSRAPSRVVTTFDGDKTVFDGRGTSIKGIVKQSGAAWLYQFVSVPGSTVNNPGYFIPAQKLINNYINSYDEFGIDIAINQTAIYVGAPGDDTNNTDAGIVFSFLNPTQKKVWTVDKANEPHVDIDLLNRVFLYNKNSNQIVADVDYIDPVKGKILGIAAQEINYQTPFDPAVYDASYSGMVWGSEQVGKVWWDISQARWLNYEQSGVEIRGSNWNSAFPGSKILCYEWVESNVPPVQYMDEKDPSSYARSNRYNTESRIDNITGVVTNKYYYWVAGKQTIPDNNKRKYSTTSIENFIANPRSSGLPHAAFLSSNAIALYNISGLLEDKNVVLNIDYDVKYNENSIHSEFQLLAEDDANSIPSSSLVTKLIDSLAGNDDSGNKVPDIKLTPGEAYGIGYRPRQTMFNDRIYALRSTVSYINSVIKKIPIVYTKDLTNFITYEKIPLSDSGAYNDTVNDDVELSYLNIELYPNRHKVLVLADGTVSDRWTIYEKVNGNWKLIKVQAYDTRRYLQKIDWVKPGIDDPKVSNYTVDHPYDLASITPLVGETVKVKDYNGNLYAVLQYTDAGWDIIKQELATYKILDEIWDASILAQNFGVETFDVQRFDDDPSVEIQKIIYACYHDIFTDADAAEKNRWFIAMIKHLLAEQHYVDYAFKTSFVKVEHRNQQAISQIPSLQKDRQDSLRQYIEEVKPYHTKIREFVSNHGSTDDLGASMTDFDLPSYYNEVTGKYTSITGKDEIDAIILERPEYQAFVNGYTFNINEVLIADTGIGFTSPPVLSIAGTDGKGKGVKLESTVVNGELTKVTVLDGGTGFTSVPLLTSNQNNNVTIEGDGVTKAFQVLPFVTDHPENVVVRNISLNKKLRYNLDYFIHGTTVEFYNAPDDNYQILIDFNAKIVPVMDNKRIRRIKDTIKFDRLPNNGGFLAQFNDSETLVGDGSTKLFNITVKSILSASSLYIYYGSTNDRLVPEVDYTVDVDSNTVSFTRAPANNQNLLVIGNPIDIREQRKSRLQGEHGIVDELFDVLSEFEWIKGDVANIQWPVPNVSEYRIYPDNSGRIQVQYKKKPGGWTAELLQAYIRNLGTSVGVDSLDITGTQVIVDGNMSLYQPSVLEWLPNTRYDTGDIIVYNNLAYTLRESVPSFTSVDSFDTENLRLYDAGEFESHINRTWAYYQPTAGIPGKDLGQLFKGIEYPGVVVKGASFREEPGFDVGNYDMSAFDQYIIGPEGVAVLDPKILDQTIYSNFLDTSLGTRPEDIITAGSGFVDPYSSHAPEESVPGRVYDALDIKVYTTPMADVTGIDDLGLLINLDAYRVGSATSFRYTPTATGGDTLMLFSSNYGRLDKEIDFTVNYVTHTVTILKTLLPTDDLYIYAIKGGGQGMIYDSGFVGDGANKSYTLQADNEQVSQSFVTINGIKQTDYTIEFFQPGVSSIIFGNTVPTPTASDYIHVSLYHTDSDIQQYVNPQTEIHTVSGNTYPASYTIHLDSAVGYSWPRGDKILVDLNNNRLRPPATAYYDGDGSSTHFGVPYTPDVDPTGITEAGLKVSLNGAQLKSSIDYTLLAYDGSTWPSIIMAEAPAEADLLTIRLSNNADYSINDDTTILLRETLEVNDGDKVRVTHFANHEKLDIRTTVYLGQTQGTASADVGFDDISFDSAAYDTVTVIVTASNDYTLNTPVQNINYLIVSLDIDGNEGGQYLMPNKDYTLIDGGKTVRLDPTLKVLGESVIVITQFSERSQQPSIGFRIFKDLNDNFNYLRLASDSITKLSRPLLISDTEIYVYDASVLPAPNLDQSIPGAIIIGGERITYFGIDYASNKLFNIRRGTAGTGAINVVPENSLIQDASDKQQIPSAHNKIWYNQGNGTATNGLGLQNSTTMQAKFLLEKPTLLQSQVFDPAYFIKGYAVPGYVEGNLY